MPDAAVSVPVGGDDFIVVKEDARAVHFLWVVLLSITLAGWWALNTFVAPTGENRIAGNIVGAAMAGGFLGAWIYEVRHPARLEISHDAIVQKRRRRKRTVVLRRTTGELAFEVRTMHLGGRVATAPVLTIPGDPEASIGVLAYDRSRVRQACESLGWRFETGE